MSVSAHVKPTLRYQLLSAFAAFVLWAGWAFWVNHGSSDNVVLIACAQGVASFTITLLMVQAIAWLYPILVRGRYSVPLPAICTVLVTGSILVLIHVIIGTPHIAATIAPALIVGFLFCLFTSIKLYRANAVNSSSNDNGFSKVQR